MVRDRRALPLCNCLWYKTQNSCVLRASVSKWKSIPNNKNEYLEVFFMFQNICTIKKGREKIAKWIIRKILLNSIYIVSLK